MKFHFQRKFDYQITLNNINRIAFISQASRAQILKKAADYIEFMRRKNSAHQQDIDDLKKQNNLLESQSKFAIFT